MQTEKVGQVKVIASWTYAHAQKPLISNVVKKTQA
jgi:hypothetical protein